MALSEHGDFLRRWHNGQTGHPASRAVPRNSPYANVVQPLHESKEGERSTMSESRTPTQWELQQTMHAAGAWRNLRDLLDEVRAALEGDSNDAEHEACQAVASFFGVSYQTADYVQDRLEYLRGCLRAECISYGEMAELQGLAEHIEPGDVELLEPAGVPEEVAYDRALLDAYFREGRRS